MGTGRWAAAETKAGVSIFGYRDKRVKRISSSSADCRMMVSWA